MGVVRRNRKMTKSRRVMAVIVAGAIDCSNDPAGACGEG